MAFPKRIDSNYGDSCAYIVDAKEKHLQWPAFLRRNIENDTVSPQRGPQGTRGHKQFFNAVKDFYCMSVYIPHERRTYDRGKHMYKKK